MIPENVQRLQDTYLDHLQKTRTQVTLFLVNGVKLQGVIADYDAFCVLLERDGQQQMVYKHSISATSPGNALDLRDHAPMAEERPRQRAVVVERRNRFRPS